MHLIAGRTGQEYNRRKNRKGAFWEDRYHATAIESGEHLWRCMVYVDLNMVRAGVVDHPAKWKWGGYNEVQKPKERYQVIDHDLLRRFLFVGTNDELAQIHRSWVKSELKKRTLRNVDFSRSIAVGSERFVKKVRETLGIRAKGRVVNENADEVFQLRESTSKYKSNEDTLPGAAPDAMLEMNMIPWDLEKFLAC